MINVTARVEQQKAEAQQKAQEAAQKKKDEYETPINPKGKLDGKAFMHLLLTELQYQDPTQPMDSEKMLQQTSQLASLETQEATNKMMKELTEQLRAEKVSGGANAQAIGAIGKLATVKEMDIEVKEDDTSANFQVYLREQVDFGEVNIYSKDNKLVRTIALDEKDVGIKDVKWDRRNDNGAKVGEGLYYAVAEYRGKDGKDYKEKMGTYPVEAVKFKDGQAYVKLGSRYFPMSEIKEFLRN